MYKLKEGKNNYQLIDCSTSIDLHTGEYVPSARSRIGGSYDKPDFGHLVKFIYEFDDISMLLPTQEPGVDSPYEDFVFHPEHEEIEYIISGSGTMCYPDGSTFDVKAGTCMYHAPGQPHRLRNHNPDPLNLLVVHSVKLSQVARRRFEEGKKYAKKGGHKLVYCPDAPSRETPGFSGDAPDKGHYVSTIFEGEKACCIYVVMKPGNSSPMVDFVSHPEVTELVYIVDGHGIGIYPDKAYNLRPGLAAYHAPEQPAKFWNNTTDEDLRLLVFYSTAKPGNVLRTHKKAVGFEVI
jgi:mannose-6-phosphate isomerase-like protein (cupin superfamily)